MGQIFVFSSGLRCGSTLLQRFLCSHSNIMIWGEHNGFLNNFFYNFEMLLNWEKKFKHHYRNFRNSGTNNFIANMNPPPKHLVEAQIIFIKSIWEMPSINIGRSDWGFKEVRYDAGIALKLKSLFPSTKIIYLTRNIIDCFISLYQWECSFNNWTRDKTLESLKYWVDINRSFHCTPGLDNTWVFSITYDRLIDSSYKTIIDLANWLGFSIHDFDKSVLSRKIYNDVYSIPDNRQKVTISELNKKELELFRSPEILELSERLGFNMDIFR